MKTPIIKYSDKFLNRISIFMNIGGITLFPFVILREKYNTNKGYYGRKAKITINHESIHIKQQLECLIIPFYILYVLEWFVKSIRYMSTNKGYRAISFEQEAYDNAENENYLKERKPYNWVKRIFLSKKN